MVLYSIFFGCYLKLFNFRSLVKVDTNFCTSAKLTLVQSWLDRMLRIFFFKIFSTILLFFLITKKIHFHDLCIATVENFFGIFFNEIRNWVKLFTHMGLSLHSDWIFCVLERVPRLFTNRNISDGHILAVQAIPPIGSGIGNKAVKIFSHWISIVQALDVPTPV